MIKTKWIWFCPYIVEGRGVEGQCGRYFVLFFCNWWMGGNIGKAIASMTIKQSYVSVCWPFKVLLVVLCVLLSPRPLISSAPVTNKPKLWSTLEAAIVATSNSLSSTCKFEWSKKHRKLGSFFLPNSSPALYLFHWPSVPVSLLKEHTASLYAVVPCVAVACCTPASLPSLWWSLFTSQFAQNWQRRRHVLHLVTSVFILSCLLSLAVFIPLLLTWNANQWSMDLEYHS